MNETTLKQNIEQSLKLFSKGNLYDNSINLLKTLGYISNRSLKFEPSTFESFLDIYPNAKNLNKGKALVSDWASIDFLFQLKAEDIMNVSQGKFVFDHQPRVDNQIIESYLFISISLKASTYTRTQLANLTREINKIFQIPVMIIIQHGESLTFSIIHRRINKKDESRDVLEKVTLIKDISIKKPHRGHIEILFDLSLHQLAKDKSFSNFVELQKAWEKTLDTSELNKKFYKEIANWYFSSQKKVSFPAGGGEDVEVRNATNLIRLITRLIFVWFIKEKGLVPDKLFDQKKLKEILTFSDPSNSTYYKAILQNLFFATLNTEMGSNRRFRGKNKNPNGLDSHYGIPSVYRYEDFFKNPQEAVSLFSTIPFLNGGLFECLDKREEKIIIDGFSDDPRNQPKVPNELFFSSEHEEDLSDFYGDKNKKKEKVRGIINIFNDYKFTIEENTPIEQEIALDPELLGKVFENLLASYNPETGATARKQTGSFYTPREIVNYMVDETLIEYLCTKLGELPNTEERLRHLFEYNQENHNFTHEETRKLIDALDDVNVLDPACGSGAFPMGVLHKLVLILNKLDPGNIFWKEKQIGKVIEISDPDVREKEILDIEQAFEDNELDYARKLFLIENCIYGVDIQPIAIQISKLRFFISLIVDQKTYPNKANLGIRPLPNLETKFVSANSLIDIDLTIQQQLLPNPKVIEKEKQLKEVRSSLFTARTPKTKTKYRELDMKIREDLANLLIEDNFGRESAIKLSIWDPYNQNLSADFFDSDWMFGVKNGFDIIIGNPPYIFTRDAGFSNEFKEYISKRYFSLLNPQKKKTKANQSGKINLFALFILRGLFDCKENGVLSYILPNNLLRTTTYDLVRKYLLNKSMIEEIVDLGSGVFENVTASTILIRLKKQKAKESHKIRAITNIGNFLDKDYTVSEIHQNQFLSNVSFTINVFGDERTQTLLSKISKERPCLGDFCIDIIEGIVAHKKLISTIPAKNSFPLVEGKTISRYFINETKKHIVWKTNEIHRTRPDYLWNAPIKILIQRISGGNRPLTAAIDKNRLKTFASVNNLLLKDAYSEYYYYFLALINSNLLNWYYANNFSNNSELTVNISKTFLEKLPIVFGNFEIQTEISKIVNHLINLKNLDPLQDTSQIEDRINQLVYIIYGLTKDEIDLIELQTNNQETKLVIIDEYNYDINGNTDYSSNTNDESSLISNDEIFTQFEYGLYKCPICGSLIMNFDLQNHEVEKHDGKSVEWKKIM